MPFFSEQSARGPEERAAALQKRMRGEEMPYPRFACRELGDVVLCATQFEDYDRYGSAAALRAALEALPEQAAIPAVAPVIRLKPKEVEAARNYRVDKSFEKTRQPAQPKPQNRKGRPAVDEDMDASEFRRPVKRRRWAGPVIVIVVLIIILLLVLRGCRDEKPEDFTFEPEPGVSESLPPVEPSPEPITEPVEPTEPVPPEESETPAEPRLSIFVDDVTWEQARDSCQIMGGHLATVDSQERLDEVIAMAEEKGASFVWLGSYRDGNGNWVNVTGEPMEFTAWDMGEPSVRDQDGTPENYLLLWYRAAAGTWTYNDMRNDPISVVPGTYRGKVAYICQFD